MVPTSASRGTLYAITKLIYLLSIMIKKPEENVKKQNNIVKYSLSQKQTSNLVGFYSAIFLTLITIITFGLALTAVPISGANAPGDGLPYPYLDTLKQFPKDYLWMITAIILILTYVVFMVSINTIADNEFKIFSQISLVFTIISATILLIDYFIQIAVVPVSLANNETEGITLITQYNPHGVFIALEELGYLVMSISFLFIAPIFTKKGRLELFIKWIFIIAFLLTIIALIIIIFLHGIEREDRFEVIAISISWLVLIINGILLSVFFKSQLKTIY